VFDHTDRKYKRGFRSLFMGWTDGATFLPLAFRHMSSRYRITDIVKEVTVRTTVPEKARRKEKQ